MYGEIHVMHGGRCQAGCCSVIGSEVIGHGVAGMPQIPCFTLVLIVVQIVGSGSRGVKDVSGPSEI